MYIISLQYIKVLRRKVYHYISVTNNMLKKKGKNKVGFFWEGKAYEISSWTESWINKIIFT